MAKKTITIDPATLKRWTEMTDANEHNEVRIEIAKALHLDKVRGGLFKGRDFVYAYECELEIVRRTWHENTAFVCIVDRAMFYEITRRYGQEVADMISECL
jgi:hypothetical protein